MPNLFRVNVLADIPPGATIINRKGERLARWTDNGKAIQRKVVATPKGDRIIARQSPKWYAKIKVGTEWQRVALYTDKQASLTRLAELQRDADRRAAGMITADTDRLALPIADLAKQYIESLRAQKKDPEHVRISEWMLNRMIEVGGWQSWRDITPSGMEALLPKLAGTASYQNKFIVRAKAFIHWLLPDGWADPLKKLRRVKEKGAKRTRERRAGTDAEIHALFLSELPDHRRLAYAFAAFNGLRRNEAAGLLSDDLHLDSPIPFIGLRQKQGQDDSKDYVPLHPYVQRLLKGRMMMPGAKVLPSVPDMKTVAKDLKRVGVALADAQGRRLDYHALRHTFSTNLDQAGCSRATKKKLMRHAHSDITDGYTHAELAEMRAALLRILPPESRQPRQQQKLASGNVVQGADQTQFPNWRGMALNGTLTDDMKITGISGDMSRFASGLQDLALNGLPMRESGDIVEKLRPSTQAD